MKPRTAGLMFRPEIVLNCADAVSEQHRAAKQAAAAFMSLHSARWRSLVVSHRMSRWLRIGVLAAALLTVGSAAAQDEVFVFDQDNPMPERVRALMACDYDPGNFGGRRPFADGF